ncbi:MAG: YCF48-related protein [Herbaspirillum sp.]
MIYFRKHSVALALAVLAGGVSPGALAQAGAPVTLSPARSDAHALHNMMLGATRAGSRIVAVGAYGYIILSDDGGASYRQADKVPVDTTLTSVSFAGAEQGWAAGHGGVILHTADGGKTWALQRSDTSVDQPLFSVWFANANEGWAAGLWSLLLHTRDGGKSWQQVKLPTAPGQQRGDLNLLHIFPGRDGALFVAAEQGVLYRSPDGGQHWEALATGSKASLWSGVVTASGAIIVGGLGGKLLRSEDGGQHWQVLASPTSGSITALRSEGNQVMASSLSGSLLVSEDDGRQWRIKAVARDALTTLELQDGRAERPIAYGKGGQAKLEASVTR